jgi:hypothetical protein
VIGSSKLSHLINIDRNGVEDIARVNEHRFLHLVRRHGSVIIPLDCLPYRSYAASWGMSRSRNGGGVSRCVRRFYAAEAAR